MGRYTHISMPLSAGAIIVLGACAAPQLETAQDLEITGSSVTQEAAREFKRLAYFEDQVMWDKASAVAFSEKALRAASGRVDTSAPESAPEEISAAYRHLASLRALGGDEVAPKSTGQAIARLDCWREQAREGYQPLHIGFCESGFKEHAANTVRVLKAAGLKTAGGYAETKSFSIPFSLGSALPKPDYNAVIEKAAAYALSQKDMRVVLGGHADRTGSAVFNRKLSEARADAVARSLAAYGVDPDKISTIGFGETYPRTRTPDGERSSENRRVEIVIGPAQGS